MILMIHWWSGTIILVIAGWELIFGLLAKTIALRAYLHLNLIDTAGISHVLSCPTDFPDPITFQHVAATYDKASGMAAIYRNGSMVTNKFLGSFTPQTSFDLYFGIRPSGAFSTTYKGLLDEVGLYRRALSPAEIIAIYQAGSAGKYSVSSPLPSAQVVVDGVTNQIASNDLTWKTNTYVFTAKTNGTVIELDGNPLGLLFDSFKLQELGSTNYNNYFLAEESLDIFKGENGLGDWTLEAWDTRTGMAANANLLGWDLQLTFSSTNVDLIVLTNRVAYTIPFRQPAYSISVYDMPADAKIAHESPRQFESGRPLATPFQSKRFANGLSSR